MSESSSNSNPTFTRFGWGNPMAGFFSFTSPGLNPEEAPSQSGNAFGSQQPNTPDNNLFQLPGVWQSLSSQQPSTSGWASAAAANQVPSISRKRNQGGRYHPPSSSGWDTQTDDTPTETGGPSADDGDDEEGTDALTYNAWAHKRPSVRQSTNPPASNQASLLYYKLSVAETSAALQSENPKRRVIEVDHSERLRSRVRVRSSNHLPRKQSSNSQTRGTKTANKSCSRQSTPRPPNFRMQGSSGRQRNMRRNRISRPWRGAWLRS